MFDERTWQSTTPPSQRDKLSHEASWHMRSFQDSDAAALVDLLKQQDNDASLRTMSPDARTVDEVVLELGECSPYNHTQTWVLYEKDVLQAFVSLCAFQNEHFLEGPVCHPAISKEALSALLQHVRQSAMEKGYPFVEAFVDVENTRVRDALRANGFAPFHTTHLYRYNLKERMKEARNSNVQLERAHTIQPEDYRQLYRDTSAQWSRRLHWNDARLNARFKDVNVQFWLAYPQLKPSFEDTQAVLADMTFNQRLADLFQLAEQDSVAKGKAAKRRLPVLGHVELEHHPASAEVELAYFGVLPTARKQGVGRFLVQHGLYSAYRLGARSVIARAHDDERAACLVLECLGFRLERSVVAFTLDL